MVSLHQFWARRMTDRRLQFAYRVADHVEEESRQAWFLRNRKWGSKPAHLRRRDRISIATPFGANRRRPLSRHQIVFFDVPDQVAALFRERLARPLERAGRGRRVSPPGRAGRAGSWDHTLPMPIQPRNVEQDCPIEVSRSTLLRIFPHRSDSWQTPQTSPIVIVIPRSCSDKSCGIAKLNAFPASSNGPAPKPLLPAASPRRAACGNRRRGRNPRRRTPA
jgi:hypothetical protein